MGLFDREIALFVEKLPSWLPQHDGDWVIIKGDNVVGLFPNRSIAYEAGVQHTQSQNFLMRMVSAPPQQLAG